MKPFFNLNSCPLKESVCGFHNTFNKDFSLTIPFGGPQLMETNFGCEYQYRSKGSNPIFADNLFLMLTPKKELLKEEDWKSIQMFVCIYGSYLNRIYSEDQCQLQQYQINFGLVDTPQIMKIVANKVDFIFRFSGPVVLPEDFLEVRVQKNSFQLFDYYVTYKYILVAFCLVLLMTTLIQLFKRIHTYIFQNRQQQQIDLGVELAESRLERYLGHKIIQQVQFLGVDDPLNPFQQHECAFCLESFQFQEIVGQFHCKHIFHYECVTHWNKFESRSLKCPICNTDLETSLSTDHSSHHLLDPNI